MAAAGPGAARGALVVMRCRCTTADPDTATGLDVLGAALGRRLGVSARPIGTPPDGVLADPRAELQRARGCLLEAGGQVDDALDAGAMPVLLAGDGAISLATLPTIARRRPDARVLWLDAHAGFHTPDSAPGLGLERMSLAGACGRWETGWPDTLPATQLVLCGTRAIDDAERGLLSAPPVRVIGTTLETLVHLQHALDGAATYVHLDVDVLDEEAMPVLDPVPGGLPAEKLLDLLDAVADACEVVGVQVCGFTGSPTSPSAAARGRDQALAEVVVATLDPLLP